MDLFESNIHQVFVKLLDGKHRLLNFGEPSIAVSALKQRIEALTAIPSHLQLLVFENSHILHDQQSLNIARSDEKFPNVETLGPDSGNQLDGDQDYDRVYSAGLNRSGKFPVVVNLLLRLRGGKGGFGSLLRGAATKAGQKKTNNFDACRDMNGRRLRHVNAEKRLEEWRAEAEERKLEKMAEEFLKKKAKEIVKSGKGNGGDSAEKYVAKYREDSDKCRKEVERSVKESIESLMSSKRKNLAKGIESAPKRLKIWLGKRNMGDSDSEDLDGDSDKEEEDNDKSIIIDNGSPSDSSKEAETSTGSITDKKLVAETVDKDSSGSGSDEVDNVLELPLKSDKGKYTCKGDHNGEYKNNRPLGIVEENRDENGFISDLPLKSVPQKLDEIGNKQPSISVSEEVAVSAEVKNSICDPVHEEPVAVSSDLQSLEKPLNFDEYQSATELEVLGLERLKSELQARGLKCGGTLQERAARLFLLKTTAIEMLPKKLLAKK